MRKAHTLLRSASQLTVAERSEGSEIGLLLLDRNSGAALKDAKAELYIMDPRQSDRKFREHSEHIADAEGRVQAELDRDHTNTRWRISLADGDLFITGSNYHFRDRSTHSRPRSSGGISLRHDAVFLTRRPRLVAKVRRDHVGRSDVGVGARHVPEREDVALGELVAPHQAPVVERQGEDEAVQRLAASPAAPSSPPSAAGWASCSTRRTTSRIAERRPGNASFSTAASLDGITDNTGSALGPGAVYAQPWLDPNNRSPIFGPQDGDPGNGGLFLPDGFEAVVVVDEAQAGDLLGAELVAVAEELEAPAHREDRRPAGGLFAEYVGRQGQDWDYFFCRPYIYPAGTGLSWHTDGRGTEQLSYTFALVDILPWGRQEEWQDSPDGWPKSPTYSKWLDSPDVARLYGPNE